MTANPQMPGSLSDPSSVSSVVPPISSSPSSALSTQHSALSTFLCRLEGLRLRAYRCPRGFWTWGYGCRIMDPLICEALDAGIPFELSRAQAEKLFSLALSRAILDALSLFPQLISYAVPRQAAIVSLSFQLGKEGLAGFHNMVRAILLGDWTRAAAELRYKNGLVKDAPSDYAVQLPDRAHETALMLETGTWQADPYTVSTPSTSSISST